MSLHDIREIRLQGAKPGAVVSVIIGSIPKAYLNDPLMVEIAPSSNPALLDWRPLVGVWVSVLDLQGNQRLSDAVVEAISDAGGKLFGFVCKGHALVLAAFDNLHDRQRATWLLKQEWEALCS